MGFLRKELSYWLDIDIFNTALVAYILHLKFKYDFTEMCLNGISIGFQGFNGVPIDYPSFQKLQYICFEFDIISSIRFQDIIWISFRFKDTSGDFKTSMRSHLAYFTISDSFQENSRLYCYIMNIDFNSISM